MKTYNEYAQSISLSLYERCPKAVFAAIAISSLTQGGGYIEEAERLVVAEWWALYHNGIVPQKPTMPEPSASEVGD